MAREYDHLFKLLIIGDSGNYDSLMFWYFRCMLCMPQLVSLRPLRSRNVITPLHWHWTHSVWSLGDSSTALAQSTDRLTESTISRPEFPLTSKTGSFVGHHLHFNIKIKSVKTKVKQCRRDFRKGNYKEIRKRLAHIDGNDKMENKTATECWDILRRKSEIVLLIVLFL